ncbi:MAG: hypothetical protein PVH41_17370 [Anaerolineae bacterium]|jgi:hypothetical protein
MERRRRANLAGGLVLILLGAGILVVQLLPGVQFWFSWPWLLIGVGVLLLVIGSVTGVPALAVPACIVGGIGSILYYQATTGDWDSWAYVWALIPGFVGVGVLLSGLLGEEGSGAVRGGATLILISLVLFAVFGSFFGALGFLGQYWPVLLILLGLVLLVSPLLRARR